ncbi:hypothetical protein MRX96_017128 [Rhipicephalus microplus]
MTGGKNCPIPPPRCFLEVSPGPRGHWRSLAGVTAQRREDDDVLRVRTYSVEHRQARKFAGLAGGRASGGRSGVADASHLGAKANLNGGVAFRSGRAMGRPVR